MFFAGHPRALHPTQALGHLVLAATLLHSAPTPANPPNAALSAVAALGIQEFSVSVPHKTEIMLMK